MSMEPSAAAAADERHWRPAFENLTLLERVHEHLRQEILADRLSPGTELSEVALSRDLGVSRGPIREAIGRLAAEGLVTVRPRRGAVVRSLSTDDLIDAYQVREALESAAVRLAVPRLTEDDFSLLEQLVEAMAVHAEASAVHDFFAANIAFHDALCRASHNRKLYEMHHRLVSEMGRYQMRSLLLRGNLRRSVEEHQRILRAARRGDAERSAELSAEHVRVPLERFREAHSEDASAGQPRGQR